jgi:hypothetical protein
MRRVLAAAVTAALSHAALADDVSKISVMTIDAKAAEAGGDSASFALMREAAPIDKPLTVYFTMSGTATNGADYASVGTSATFAASSPTATVLIKPIADALTEGTETVVLTLDAKPGAYTIGDYKSDQATITDSPPSAGGGTPGKPGKAPPTQPPPPVDTYGLPPPDRTGSLLVTMTFDGAGNWKHASNGSYASFKFHRVLTYAVPLRGIYSAGAQIIEIDRREHPGGAMALPNFKRYLALMPRDEMAPVPRVCGKGTVQFADESHGMAVGDPGQPPLIPFVQTWKGGGPFPSGDKTVPERDLCFTRVSLDYEKHVFHMILDGSDSHVKVTDTINGHSAPPYNALLDGDESSEAKAKMTWFDMPMASGSPNVISGTRTFENFNVESTSKDVKFPLTARVEYRLTLDPPRGSTASR